MKIESKREELQMNKNSVELCSAFWRGEMENEDGGRSSYWMNQKEVELCCMQTRSSCSQI
jgi:hypothetical protein